MFRLLTFVLMAWFVSVAVQLSAIDKSIWSSAKSKHLSGCGGFSCCCWGNRLYKCFE
jgi:hypothetical protein